MLSLLFESIPALDPVPMLLVVIMYIVDPKKRK
jgi:hypothetical protein